MEAIFFAVIALISVTSFANAEAPRQRMAPSQVATVSATAAIRTEATAPMQTVTVTAKRLTAAEKAAAQ